MRNRLAAAATFGATLAVTLPLAACTSADDQFCEQLSEQYRLDALSRAVRSNDAPGIRRELAHLRSLEETAPAAVLDDLRSVVDVTAELVAAVTSAGEAGSDPGPVDLTRLNDELAKIEPAAQRIADYADQNCGIRL